MLNMAGISGGIRSQITRPQADVTVAVATPHGNPCGPAEVSCPTGACKASCTEDQQNHTKGVKCAIAGLRTPAADLCRGHSPARGVCPTSLPLSRLHRLNI